MNTHTVKKSVKNVGRTGLPADTFTIAVKKGGSEENQD